MATRRSTSRMPVALRSEAIDKAVDEIDPKEDPQTPQVEVETSKAANMEPPVIVNEVEIDNTPKAEAAAVAYIERADLIIDDATGKTPNPDTLFCQVTPYGTTKVSTARLVEHSWVPGQHTPTVRLLIAEGQRVAPESAEIILASIRRQIEAEAAE